MNGKLNSEEKNDALSFLEVLSKNGETYVYIKALARFYWIEKMKFFRPWDVANNLMVKSDVLKKLRMSEELKSYDDITYKFGWEKWCYNLLDENLILKPSKNSKLHPQIKELIENVCWHKDENIDYLHKIILYKYVNINSFDIPAIVLYGAWGSWKGTLISLLATIFWEKNVLKNLWQKDLTWNFDSYNWKKIIVDFSEIVTNNTSTDIKVLNKLKNLVWAEIITVNEKWVQQYQINNLAWFFISSNSNKPIHLDEKEKGNRRFTVIKSMKSLKNWGEINKIIKDKKIVSDYLKWLHGNYKEVLEYEKMEALDNNDKRELEEMNRSEANNYWDWMMDNYPNYTWKRTIREINDMLNEYCLENDLIYNDFNKFFWKNSKYPKKKIRISSDKTCYGVVIPEYEKITKKDVEEVFK